MDVQQVFRSLNFCLKALTSIGLFINNKYLRIFWINLHLILFNGYLLGTIWSLNFKVDEPWKNAEKLNLVLGILGLNINLIKTFTGIGKIEQIKERAEKIFVKIREKSDEATLLPIKNELKFVERLFKSFIIFTVICLSFGSSVSRHLGKLPFEIFYPFDLEKNAWFQTATLHQAYCNTLGCIVLVCNNFLSVIFISYSIGFLGSIHKQLYFKVGHGREQVLVNCMKSYKMIKKLIKDVEEHFGWILFYQAAMNTIRLGILLFVIMETNEIASQVVAITLGLALSFDFFIPFNIGQDLEISSKNAIEGFSYPKWHDINEPVENARRKFLEKHSEPLKMNLKKIINLNLRTFIRALLLIFIIFFTVKLVFSSELYRI
jgi:hypothetical protein